MAGMEALGRLTNIIPNVTTNIAFKVRGASGVMVCVSGATAVVTLAQDSTFGGAFATAAPVIKNIYWQVTAATTVWNKLTFINGTAPFAAGPLSTFTLGTTTGLTTATVAVFHIFTSELSDPFDYIKVTMTGSGIAQVVPYDLVHQRGPANLEILAS
jgi:hypothetical protein